MEVIFEKKALEKLRLDNVEEVTIYVKTAGGWSPVGAPELIIGGFENLDGSYEEKEVDNIKVNVKTCIKSTSNELTVAYGGLFKKVFYVTGALEL